ncbi:hypothetical protein ACLMCB_22805 [Paenibacillus sp. S29]
MKKKDKLDEFDFKSHAENMSAVLKYVMDYLNHYLNPEEYDYENIKTEQSALKIAQEIGGAFPESENESNSFAISRASSRVRRENHANCSDSSSRRCGGARR